MKRALLLVSFCIVSSTAIPAMASEPFSAPWQEDLLGPDAPARPSLWTPSASPASLASRTLMQSGPADLGGGAPRRVWPILASAIWPGLGETLTGYRRGWAMMAIDAGMWVGIVDRSSVGDDWENKYEAFALEHWSEEEWASALGSENFRLYFSEEILQPTDVALYVSREDDEREWFENLGKWNVFAWGWREFWDPDWNGENNADVTGGAELYYPLPDDPQTWFFPNRDATMTPLRDEYVQMRGKSNDAYSTRDTLFNVTVLLRVISVVQMAYLEGFIGGRYSEVSPAGGLHSQVERGPRADWVVGSIDGDGALVGWKVEY